MSFEGQGSLARRAALARGLETLIGNAGPNRLLGHDANDHLEGRAEMTA
jgi:hypothetical protein